MIVNWFLVLRIVHSCIPFIKVYFSTSGSLSFNAPASIVFFSQNEKLIRQQLGVSPSPVISCPLKFLSPSHWIHSSDLYPFAFLLMLHYFCTLMCIPLDWAHPTLSSNSYRHYAFFRHLFLFCNVSTFLLLVNHSYHFLLPIHGAGEVETFAKSFKWLLGINLDINIWGVSHPGESQ